MNKSLAALGILLSGAILAGAALAVPCAAVLEAAARRCCLEDASVPGCAEPCDFTVSLGCCDQAGFPTTTVQPIPTPSTPVVIVSFAGSPLVFAHPHLHSPGTSQRQPRIAPLLLKSVLTL
jgi:hypothetical protein